jgi:hypothetical protein
MKDDERRRTPRAKVNLKTRWEGASTSQDGTITSLSKNGCFVLSGGNVEPKELIRLEIHLGDEEPFYFWAEVVDAAFDIGFAVRFNSMSETDEVRLHRLLVHVLEG